METKLLYGMLLSRADLSRKNRWADGQGRIYLYFPITLVMERLSCGEQKASRLMRQLESSGLIVRKRHGCGKSYRIFPLTVAIADDNRDSHG